MKNYNLDVIISVGYLVSNRLFDVFLASKCRKNFAACNFWGKSCGFLENIS